METNHHINSNLGFIAAAVIGIASLIGCAKAADTTTEPTAKHGLYLCTEDEVKAPGELVACSHPGGRSF